VVAALDEIAAGGRVGASVLFTAHSVPIEMAQTSEYEQQLHEACRLVAENLGLANWKLAYQSRSGPPAQKWLEPDIGDVLRATEPGQNVVVAPIGFISDHMEVLYDLDTEARAISDERKLNMVRAGTAGVHPKFIELVRELIRERMGDVEPRAVGKYGPHHEDCLDDCCPPPARRASSPASDSSPRAIAQR
jgi:ferrochelatase